MDHMITNKLGAKGGGGLFIKLRHTKYMGLRNGNYTTGCDETVRRTQFPTPGQPHNHQKSHRAFLGGRDVEGVLLGVDVAEPRGRLRGGVMGWWSIGAGDGDRVVNGDEAVDEAGVSCRTRKLTARGAPG
jgi:hypothetical protein